MKMLMKHLCMGVMMGWGIEKMVARGEYDD